MASNPTHPADLLADPRHQAWGPPGLPSWLQEFFPVQRWAVQKALQAYEDGARVVLLQAPTGHGKTATGEAIRRVVAQREIAAAMAAGDDEPEHRCTYVCSSIQLMDQFRNAFQYSAYLSGRANYTPLDGPQGATCEDCDLREGVCSLCKVPQACPYIVARERAVRAPLSVTNTAYLLTEANTARRFSGRNMIVCDEADVLEKSLISAVSVGLSLRALKTLKLTRPKVTVPEDWERWLWDDAIPAVKERLKKLGRGATDPLVVRERNQWSRLLDRMQDVARQVAGGGWVFTGEGGAVEWRPITGRRIGGEYLWRHADLWLLMSATIIDPQALLADLGWPEIDNRGSWALVDCPSTFSVTKRQVREAPVVNMRYGDRGWARPKMARAIREIATWHPDERVLVHAHSKELARELIAGMDLPGRTIAYTSRWEKDRAIQQYRASRNGILVAYSLDRGFDSPETGVVVVAKMPYPARGDKAVDARLFGTGRSGQHWYNIETLRGLIQATGRATRSVQDSSVSYLLDQAWVSGGDGRPGLKQKVRRYIPEWWREALVTEGDWAHRLRQVTRGV